MARSCCPLSLTTESPTTEVKEGCKLLLELSINDEVGSSAGIAKVKLSVRARSNGPLQCVSDGMYAFVDREDRSCRFQCWMKGFVVEQDSCVFGELEVDGHVYVNRGVKVVEGKTVVSGEARMVKGKLKVYGVAYIIPVGPSLREEDKLRRYGHPSERTRWRGGEY
ncbi:hypothetical protein E2C01_044631 [Portunus trituberculatus]|uniref:Uncharacterized protein n=1 Tax=Portunus trituberculatus TaxID=210409 RepID=A0A5B7FZP6_PORTR|nr:hypothetical protein [Portunus trituberculatus]